MVSVSVPFPPPPHGGILLCGLPFFGWVLVTSFFFPDGAPPATSSVSFRPLN